MARIKPSTVGNLAVKMPSAGNRVATAAYVATISGELAAMAERQHLHTLHYLLDLVRLEAEDAAKR